MTTNHKTSIFQLKNLRADIFASCMVFLLALPFCLGAALASGMPLLSGIITAGLGGIFVSFLGSSQLTIKTPSLSIVAVIALSFQYLGNNNFWLNPYKELLTILVLAGAIQFLFGLFRLGEILYILPEAIIYGLLAVCGGYIILQQIPFLLGFTPKSFSFWYILVNIPYYIWNMQVEILIVGLVCVMIMFSFSSLRYDFVPIIPAEMVTVLVGVILAFYFNFTTFEEYRKLFLPYSYQPIVYVWEGANFLTQIQNPKIWYYAVVIALLGSLETILNLKTIDSLDFYRRKSNLQRELMALGFVNSLGGIIGALPMVSSLEYSSTNVNSRAKTRLSGFIFGILILGAGYFLIPIFTYIPITVLSGILIYHAYKLFSPSLFKNIYYIGPYQLLMFIVTIVCTLLGGILLGILGGYISSLIVYMRFKTKLKHLFRVDSKTVDMGNNRYTIRIRSEALASNYLHLKTIISKLPKDATIYLDFAKSPMIDYNFLELVYQHPYNYENQAGSMELQGMDDHKLLSKHPLSTRILMPKGSQFDVKTTFGERQLDVWGVASINNTKFRPNMTYDGSKLQGFKFALGYEIKYRENKFSKNFISPLSSKPIKIEFFDVFFSKGIRMSEQNKFLSGYLITDLPNEIPDFTLTQESFMSRVLQTVGYEDINFDNFPFFSEKYLLKGENEKSIRDFFSDKLIQFLEKNMQFNIECAENRILVYLDVQIMNRTEIEDTLIFIEQMLQIIYTQEENLAEIEN
ncbi:MAG: SulP family inorganic anion transporter [Bacteroidetes bacterium]|nr:MAG: SulP family inorganic anion transporter [Bacteroidota bacterium]TAG86104.1 MAG: SulP family inorganic anion transporter [Bacteroidota bacterium]